MTKRIGVREIARLAGVSVGTVDRALNGRKEINEKTRQRILWIADKNGYRPNLAARALSIGGAGLSVGVCIPREIRYFYDQLRNGILEEAARYRQMGLEILYDPVERLDADQFANIRRLLGRGIKALIVTPGDPVAMAPLIDEAEKRHGVRVVCVASDNSMSSRSSAISVEPHLNGVIAGELMAKFVPAGSRVAIVTGMLRTEDHRGKVEGFQKSFPVECPGGAVSGLIEGHEDEAETFRKCRDLLSRDETLAGIYVNTVNCLPVCRALHATGRAGKVRVIATDAFSEAVRYIEDRTVTACIYQNPYLQGQLAVRMIADHFTMGEPFPPTRYLSPVVVLRSNLHLLRELDLEACGAGPAMAGYQRVAAL